MTAVPLPERTKWPPSAIRIGISGWRYAPWRGEFYPPKLVQAKELAYASRVLPTIEVNGSFYALQRPAAWLDWYDATPEGFVFSVKAPRYITHIRRARDVEQPVANFLASGVLALREKLGPLLWQFPPSFRFDPDRFDTFFALLPHDTRAALALAKHHEPFMRERVWLETDRRRPMRHAVEIRHESFVDERFIDMLRRHGIALVIADTQGKAWPRLDDVTADFLYLRLHGSEGMYQGRYSDNALDVWAKHIRRWHDGGEPRDSYRVASRMPRSAHPRDVFCYFDNDQKVRAPFDAQRLMARLIKKRK